MTRNFEETIPQWNQRHPGADVFQSRQPSMAGSEGKLQEGVAWII